MNHTTLNLWIVDDEPAMCQGVLRTLEGFSIIFDDLDVTVKFTGAAMDSGEALLARIDQEEAPDLLLLDSKLPGADGIEVLEIIGKRNLQIVTIMITAYATLAHAVNATKLGAFDFLAKPFTPAELRHAISRATREIILTRRTRQLEQEKRLVRFEFLSVLAHELKSPLAALEGYVDILRQQPSTECLDRMDARIQGMRKLIMDLLDLTALESGRRQRKLQPEDLADVARSVVAQCEPAALARGVTISVLGTAPCLLDADRSELEMLIGNLVSNAIKYNVPGGKVTVEILDPPEAVVLRVSDTGIGISQSDQARLYAEFARIKNSRTRNIEGSGLGLSIVKRIAALYGATIQLDSEENQGCVFTVTLPRSPRPS